MIKSQSPPPYSLSLFSLKKVTLILLIVFYPLALATATPIHDDTTNTPGTTTRVNLGSQGEQSNHHSMQAVISSNGRFVAFATHATNLAPDNNTYSDIYLRDITLGLTQRITLAPDGSESNGRSLDPTISANGRYIAFTSYATNLVPDDTNLSRDIFLHDRQTGLTELVSLTHTGQQSNNISMKPSLSSDGRYIVFVSEATNLVPNDNNNNQDIFIRDRLQQTTKRISHNDDGVEGNSNSYNPVISANGRYIIYASSSHNLVPNDTNGVNDIFRHDLATNTTILISQNEQGIIGNGHSQYPDISADGRYITYYSQATNLVPNDNNQAFDIFWHDTVTNQTVRASRDSNGREANDSSFYQALSGNGRYITFMSYATNLVPTDTNNGTDIFLFDTHNQQIKLLSINTAGQQANNSTAVRQPAISNNGFYVVFDADATNLIYDDTNEADDIFYHNTIHLDQLIHNLYLPFLNTSP
ncbi:MAG TPA: hypothetical protein VLL52_10935 [Anaerolineae bacterium]|nr:hypothetical protein [Anaerolineae bacterium]